MSESKSSKSSRSFDKLSTDELVETIGKLKKPSNFAEAPADKSQEMTAAALNFQVVDISLGKGGSSVLRITPYAGAGVGDTKKEGPAPLKFYIDFLPVTDKQFREKLVDLLKFPQRLIVAGDVGKKNSAVYRLCTYLGISGDSKSKIEQLEHDLNKEIELAYKNLSLASFDVDEHGKSKGIVALIKKKKRFDKYKSAIMAAQKAQSETMEIPLTDIIGKDGGYIQNPLPPSFYMSKLASAGLDNYSPVIDYINKKVNMTGIETLRNILAAGAIKGDSDEAAALLGGEAQEISLLFSRGVEPRKISSKSVKIVDIYSPPKVRGMTDAVRDVTSSSFTDKGLEAVAFDEQIDEKIAQLEKQG